MGDSPTRGVGPARGVALGCGAWLFLLAFVAFAIVAGRSFAER